MKLKKVKPGTIFVLHSETYIATDVIEVIRPTVNGETYKARICVATDTGALCRICQKEQVVPE